MVKSSFEVSLEVTSTPVSYESTGHILSRLRQDNLPDVVYHYTSPRGLLGIVESGSIWATDIRYLNDSQEYEFGSDLARDYIMKRIVDPSTPDIEQRIYHLLNTYMVLIGPSPLYVASFSEVADLLSQWRAYCPKTGGFAIGYSSKVLVEATDLSLIPCIYGHTEQLSLVQMLIDDVLRDFHTRTHEQEPEIQRDLTGAAMMFLDGLNVLAAAFKHEGFQEEREWRLIETERGRMHAVQFREGLSGIVPFTSLNLKRDNGTHRIDEIVVGPNPHAPLAKAAVERLLQSYTVVHDGVRISKVPYRTW